LFELADLSSEFQPFADQVQDAPIEGFDVTPVLFQQRRRCFAG
jgi:hypothetical protein